MHDMAVDVLFEDNHLLILNKPAGILVHGDKTGDTTLLDLAKSYLKVKYHKPGAVFLGVPHRLDRPVSGVLILARTSKALNRLNSMFNAQKVTKLYLAITDRAARKEELTLNQWLLKDRRRNVVRSVKAKQGESKLATTQMKLHLVRDGLSLWQLQPLTGRSHQLRVAMQSNGIPILGDVKYGGSTIHDPRRICLHCYEMRFEHPVRREPLIIRASLPNFPYWQTFELIDDPTD